MERLDLFFNGDSGTDSKGVAAAVRFEKLSAEQREHGLREDGQVAGQNSVFSADEETSWRTRVTRQKGKVIPLR